MSGDAMGGWRMEVRYESMKSSWVPSIRALTERRLLFFPESQLTRLTASVKSPRVSGSNPS